MRISDWSSDVCSSYLPGAFQLLEFRRVHHRRKLVGDQLVDIDHARVERGDGVSRDDQLAVHHLSDQLADQVAGAVALAVGPGDAALGDDLVEQAAFGGSSFSLRCGFGFALGRKSEEHTSELQSLMRISYAVFCLKKKKNKI